jgi:DNA polymerase I-like protein with 3'-5' exonuclease and polymerase domains
MKIIALDFETYYDREFSLKKLTTEEYIRDSRFETIGVGVKEDDGSPATWVSGTKAQIKKYLDSLDLGQHLVLAHNAMFDAAILNWHFGISPRGWLDTLSMARALHTIEVGGSLAALAEYYKLGAKGTEVIKAEGKRRTDFTAEELAAYGEYCKNDCELTLDLFRILSQNYANEELKLIDLTIRMFSEPVLVLNQGVLKSHLFAVQSTKEKLLESVTMVDKDQLMSNVKFAGTLRALGVEPPMKISPTTGKETYAFSKSDEAFKALLEHENINVQAITAARLGVKSTLEETRTQRFIEIGERGTLPIPLRYYAAHTGRWGGDDKVNMQNLPRGSALKHAIFAPMGHMMIDSDSSQIEARTLAWLAGQDDLVAAFEAGEDVYKKMASAIYVKPEADVTKDERFVGKTTILGAGYGMGAAKFQAQLKVFGVDMELDECRRVIQVYRDTYPRIPALWRAASEALEWVQHNQISHFGRNDVLVVEGAKGIKLPNGMYIKYPNLRATQKDDGGTELVYDTKRGKATIPNRIYGGKVVENVCQALARIIIGKQMLLVAKKYKVVMTVHDAIACVVPEHQVETAQEFVEMCMKIRPDWALDLPLSCEAGHGRSYGEC